MARRRSDEPFGEAARTFRLDLDLAVALTMDALVIDARQAIGELIATARAREQHLAELCAQIAEAGTADTLFTDPR